MEKKNILISHAFGPDNRGDHEILLKLITVIRSKYGNECFINVFTSFPEKSEIVFNDDKIKFTKSPISLAGKRKSIKNIIEVIIQLISFFCYYIIGFKFFLKGDDKAKMLIIEKADAVFYCPGGYLYSNRFSYYVNIINGILLKKSVCSIIFSPMSIGPFNNSIDRFFVRFLFNRNSIVFLRESYSYDLAKSLNIKNIHLTTDLAWLNASIDSNDLTWKDHFVITIIDWDYNDIGNEVYFKERYFQEILKCCKKLYSLSNNKVVLFNQVGSGKGESSDEILIRKICETIPDMVLFQNEELTPDVLKSRLKSSLGLVASRFHSALFAIQADCKFVALAYQPKAEFILKDLNMSSYCRSIIDFSGEEVALFLNGIDSFSYKDELVVVKGECERLLKENFIDLL